ncbi:MAG: nucleotidyltransferase domain-containing protein [Acidimicrobiales bacterium]
MTVRTARSETLTGADRPTRRRSRLPHWTIYGRLPESLRDRLDGLRIVRRLKEQVIAMPAGEVLSILDAFAAGRVGVWLAGGWGIDALTGRQTRRHVDVDLVVDTGDELAAANLLAGAGYRFQRQLYVPGAGMPDSRVYRHRAGYRADLHPVAVHDRVGASRDLAALRLDGFGPDSFGTGFIAGRAVGCVGPEVQIVLHGGYELRDRDLQDLEVLRALLAKSEALP